MAKTVKREFPRVGGWKTTEWLEDCPSPHTLAYLDEEPDGKYTAVVFDPSTSGCRGYKGRSEERARGIIARHLERAGYEEVQ